MNYEYGLKREDRYNRMFLDYFAGGTVSLAYLSLPLHQRKILLLDDYRNANHQHRMLLLELLFKDCRTVLDDWIDEGKNRTY